MIYLGIIKDGTIGEKHVNTLVQKMSKKYDSYQFTLVFVDSGSIREKGRLITGTGTGTGTGTSTGTGIDK